MWDHGRGGREESGRPDLGDEIRAPQHAAYPEDYAAQSKELCGKVRHPAALDRAVGGGKAQSAEVPVQAARVGGFLRSLRHRPGGGLAVPLFVRQNIKQKPRVLHGAFVLHDAKSSGFRSARGVSQISGSKTGTGSGFCMKKGTTEK